MYHHRSGKLKQQNKSHKTDGHTSNRALDRANHGRVEGTSATAQKTVKLFET